MGLEEPSLKLKDLPALSSQAGPSKKLKGKSKKLGGAGRKIVDLFFVDLLSVKRAKEEVRRAKGKATKQINFFSIC